MTRDGGGEPATRTPLGASWFEIADALILLATGAGTGPGVRQGHDSGEPRQLGEEHGTHRPASLSPEDESAPSGPGDGLEDVGAVPPPGTGAEDGRPGSPTGRPDRSGEVLAALATLFPGPAARSGAPVETARRVETAPSRSRELTRALRPFKRTTASTTEVDLDEAATADTAALSGRWIPIHQPRSERWMDAVLVIDTSLSMTIWRHVTAEFEQALRHTGAFRDIRVRRIDGDRLTEGDLRWQVGRPTRPARRPDLGRCVVLVLTDGVGAAWRGRKATRLLEGWTRQASVAVLHMLAQPAWHRTGLPAQLLRVAMPGPGAPNRIWKVWGAEPDAQPVVPVLELAPTWLGHWARLIAGGDKSGHEIWATLLGQPAPLQMLPDGPAAPHAMERVSRFQADATPAAWGLAARLAAVPLNIPTMEYVLQISGADTGPGELAEVMLSGLLRQVGPDPLNESEIGYEFHDGVRELLLTAGSRDETRHLLRSTLDRLGRTWRPLRDLGMLLDDPHASAAGLPLPERLIPYAHIQVKVARALSGPYLASSRSLRTRLDRFASPRSAADARRERESPAAIIQGPQPEVKTVTNPQNPNQVPPESGTVSGHARGSVEVPREYPKGVPVSLPLVRSAPAAEERRAGDPPPVWNVQPRNPSFTGRGKELDALHQRLSAEGAAAVLPEALHGLGGVGKSQIAVEYAYKHAAEYDAVWWISAERPEQIRQSLARLATQLGIESGGEGETTIAAVLDALRNGRPYRRWILIFDNAEDPEAVRSFFPTGGPGKILVTSRNAQWARIARTVDVDVFTTAESVELLSRRGPELDPEQAGRIAHALGNLPLAIEQAAAWLSETGMPVDEYLQVFEDERADLDSRRNELLAAGVPMDYPEPVAAAWNMSLGRLSERQPGALQLLQICSFFAPEPIPRRLFTGVRGVELPRELATVLQDPIKLGHAIREINRYALIKINHRDNTIQMHRLVRAVLVGRMSPQERADMRHGAHVLLANYDPQDVAAVNWPRYTELLVHARFSRALECDDHWVRQMVGNVIRFLNTSGDHVTCREYGREVVRTWSDRLGESDLQTLAVAATLGHALRNLGNYEEASELDDQSLSLLRANVGDEHPNTLAAVGSVSQNAQIRGDFAASAELEHERWRRALREFGDGDPTSLAAANDYALALRAVGTYAKALEIDTQAREAATRSLGYDALLTLLITSNLSIDVRENGDYLGSRSMQEETLLRVRHVIKNRSAPVALIAARTLAVARRKAGDHASALELNQETLRLYRSKFGEKNLNVAATVLNLSMDLRQNADLEQARTVGTESLKTLRDLLGARHPYALAAAADLAVTLRLLGETDQALAMDKETHTAQREVLGEEHPGSLSCAINLASDHYSLADYAEATEINERTLPLCRRRLGEDHPATLACAMNLSLDLRALGRGEEGEQLHRDTLERYRRVLGGSHPATVGAARGMRADCDVEVLR